MSDWTQSQFQCPACGEPLFRILTGPDGSRNFLLWCGNGPCPSHEANVGAEARTENAAYAVLRAKIEAEDR